MPNADALIRLLARTGAVPSPVLSELRKRMAQLETPIAAEEFAERLVDRNVISRELAESLLNELGTSLRPTQNSADELRLTPLSSDKIKLTPDFSSSGQAEELRLTPLPSDSSPRSSARSTSAVSSPVSLTKPPVVTQPPPVLSPPKVVAPTPTKRNIDVLPSVPPNFPPDFTKDVITGGDGGSESDGLSSQRKFRFQKKTVADETSRSNFMTILGGSIVILLFVGVVLFFSMVKRTAETKLRHCDQSYSSGAYGEAIVEYDDFIKKFPTHNDISHAEARLALSRMLLVSSERKIDVVLAANAVEQEINRVAGEKVFGDEVVPELVSILPVIAEAAVARCEELLFITRQSSPTSSSTYSSSSPSASETNIHDTTLSEIDQLLKKTDIMATLAVKYLPDVELKSKRWLTIYDKMEYFRNQLQYTDKLQKVVSSVRTRISQPENRTAKNQEAMFSDVDSLTTEYPAMKHQEIIRQLLQEITLFGENHVVRASVKMVPLTPQDNGDTPSVVTLAHKTVFSDTATAVGSIAITAATAEYPLGIFVAEVKGTLYGVDTISGDIVWQKTWRHGGDGLAAGFTPLQLSDTMFAVFGQSQLDIMDYRTGKTLYRESFSEPVRNVFLMKIPSRSNTADTTATENFSPWNFSPPTDTLCAQFDTTVVLWTPSDDDGNDGKDGPKLERTTWLLPNLPDGISHFVYDTLQNQFIAVAGRSAVLVWNPLSPIASDNRLSADILFLGHQKHAVVLPPIFFDDKVCLAEQIGSSHFVLKIYRIDRDTMTLAVLQEIPLGSLPVSMVSGGPDGKHLVIGCLDGQLLLYRKKTGDSAVSRENSNIVQLTASGYLTKNGISQEKTDNIDKTRSDTMSATHLFFVGDELWGATTRQVFKIDLLETQGVFSFRAVTPSGGIITSRPEIRLPLLIEHGEFQDTSHFIRAISVSKMSPIWRQQLGEPIVAVHGTNNDMVGVYTASGKMFSVKLDEKSAAENSTEHSVAKSTESPVILQVATRYFQEVVSPAPLSQVSSLPSGHVLYGFAPTRDTTGHPLSKDGVIAALTATNRLTLLDPDDDNRAGFRWLRLPAPYLTPPQLFDSGSDSEGVILTLSDGSIRLMNPLTGQELARPFQLQQSLDTNTRTATFAPGNLSWSPITITRNNPLEFFVIANIPSETSSELFHIRLEKDGERKDGEPNRENGVTAPTANIPYLKQIQSLQWTSDTMSSAMMTPPPPMFLHRFLFFKKGNRWMVLDTTSTTTRWNPVAVDFLQNEEVIASFPLGEGEIGFVSTTTADLRQRLATTSDQKPTLVFTIVRAESDNSAVNSANSPQIQKIPLLESSDKISSSETISVHRPSVDDDGSVYFVVTVPCPSGRQNVLYRVSPSPQPSQSSPSGVSRSVSRSMMDVSGFVFRHHTKLYFAGHDGVIRSL